MQEDLLGDTVLGVEGSRRVRSEALFAEFWSAYPKKVNKADAQRVWDRLVLQKGVDPVAIIAGCRTYAKVIQKSKTERKFIKGPERWLNAGCWEDEVVADDDGTREPHMVFTESEAPEPDWGEG